MLSADDLLVFAEVARRRRVTDAARQLRISHTTVSRHISRLERAVDQRLFDRNVEGWALTEAGRHLLVHAEAVEAALTAAREESFTTAPELSGPVRIIAPDGFGIYVLVPALATLRGLHPSLVVEVVTANRHAMLTPREFDVAVTIERPQARAVSVRKLTDYSLAFYASPGYLATHPAIERIADLRGHTLIWYVDEALDQAAHSLLDGVLPDVQPRIQINSITGHIAAAQHGLGVAFLPRYIGESQPGLVRLQGLRPDSHRSYWLSVPRDLERLARVRAVSEFMVSLVAGDAAARFGP